MIADTLTALAIYGFAATLLGLSAYYLWWNNK